MYFSRLVSSPRLTLSADDVVQEDQLSLLFGQLNLLNLRPFSFNLIYSLSQRRDELALTYISHHLSSQVKRACWDFVDSACRVYLFS